MEPAIESHSQAIQLACKSIPVDYLIDICDVNHKHTDQFLVNIIIWGNVYVYFLRPLTFYIICLKAFVGSIA